MNDNNNQSSIRDYERDLWEMEERQSSFRKYQLIFQIYIVFGALMGVLSLAFFFVRKIPINLSSDDGFILLTAGIGFAISLVSWLFLFLRRQRSRLQLERDSYLISASEFLLQWATFENAGRAKLDAMGKEFNRMSIRDVISQLNESGVIGMSEIGMLEEALRFRNSLVHGATRIDEEHLARMTRLVQELVKRVEAHS